MSRAWHLTAGLLSVALLGGIAPAAQGQLTSQATINADLTVSAVQPLIASALQVLQFGTVDAGTTKTIAPGDNVAGQFSVAGQTGLEVSLSITLPGSLQGIGGAAGKSVPISFGAGAAQIDNNGAQTLFDPSNPLLSRLSAGIFAVRIGASVNIPIAQVAGEYIGPITLNVAYQ